MSFLRIRQLTPAFRQGSILVRVSRMWDYRGGKDDGDLQHVDLVLVDQEGTPIYAEIGAAHAESKKSLLLEGGIYVLKRFIVTDSKTSYRSVDSKFMIHITHLTLIEEYSNSPPDIPLYVYNLTKLSDVPSLVGETRSFIDIIGLITEVSELESLQLQNQTASTKRRRITIQDTNQTEVNIYLWGERAIEFDDDDICATSEEKPIVTIFVGLLAKPYKGESCLSGNAACRWYINPNVPEVNMFLHKLKKDVKPITRVSVTPVPIPAKQLHVEPKLISLAELKATNPYDFPREGFRCTVTLTKYSDNQSWWFPSCNRCSRTCLPDGNGYRCPRDQCTGCKFKYKPCYSATDGTAEVELVFFDDMGRRLLGKEVKQLMRTSRSSGPIPSEIAAQIGQKYQFTVNVTSKAFERSNYSYDVKRINCAYGRQPTIPAIELPRFGEPALTQKVHHQAEDSSGSQMFDHQRDSDLSVPISNVKLRQKLQSGISADLADLEQQENEAFPTHDLHSPLQQHQDIVTSPPPISPLTTADINTQQSSAKLEEPIKQTSARKRLFKDDMLSENPTEQIDPDIEDDDDNSVDSDSDKHRRGSYNKVSSTKRTRKH